MRWLDILFGFLFLIFVIYIFIPVNLIEDSYSKISSEKEINGNNNSDFMYFPSSNISYSFNPEEPCSENKINRMRDSFKIIENVTNGLLNFEYKSPEENVEGGIVINCYNESSYDEYGDRLMAEGGAYYYVGERIILGGEIDFYPNLEDDVWCEKYPSTEIHEILHVFGFDHIFDDESIMFEGYQELIIYEDDDFQNYVCPEIDVEVVECLKNIYSNGVEGSSCENVPAFCYERFCPPIIKPISKSN